MKSCAILSHNGKELPFLIQRLIKNTAKLCYVARKVPLQELKPNESGRKKRSQFEFGLIALLTEIFRCTDLMTLKVGQPQGDDGFRNATLNYLSIRSGLHITRVKRIIAQLKYAGYINISEQIKQSKKGALVFSVTVKKVSYKLLKELGVKTEEIEAYQHFKRKTHEIKPIKKGLEIVKRVIKKVTKVVEPPKKEDIKRRMLEQASRIKEQHPHLSLMQIYRLIEEHRKKPPP